MIVNIISYNRADSVITARWLKGVNIVVPKSQEADYRKFNKYNEIVAIPDELDGNCAKKKNAVLNLFKGEDVVIMDDDLLSVGYIEEGANHAVEAEYFMEFCENMFDMTRQLGTIQWGVNMQSDPKFYREYSPFSLSSCVLGPWTNIINTTELRFDETIYLKEDYDFSLKVLNRYRKILRNNKWYYQSKHLTTKGGLAGVRNRQREREHNELLQQKWGSEIVTIGRLTQGGNVSTNPVIRVPIKGI